MKTRHLCLLASVLSVTFVSAQAPWSEADPDVQLKAAMNIELVKGDLGAAIAEYKRIAAGPDTSRAVAARSKVCARSANALRKQATGCCCTTGVTAALPT